MVIKIRLDCDIYFIKTLRQYIKTPEKYVTTGHERDAETGLDYRGARFYDADVARFLSLDPLAAEFPAWSDYNYVLGNPVMLVDPDGKAPQDIIVGEEDQEFFLKQIHELTDARYTFEGNKMVKDNSIEQSSDTYSKQIDMAINSENKIFLQKADAIYNSTYQIDASVDVFHGGGVTSETYIQKTDKDGNVFYVSDATITISGNSPNPTYDTDGNILDYNAADILLHELVGHAIPKITGNSWTGNAIDNENIVRRGLKLKERKKEDYHRE